MPRIPQVQRTMKTVMVKALCLDLTTQKTSEITIRVPRGNRTTTTALMNATQQAIANEKITVLHIMNAVNETVVCTMTEQEYLNHANIITIKGE